MTQQFIEAYFSALRPLLRVEYDLDREERGEKGIREAQAGAYWALRSYFTTQSDPAIVVMPTGSGKTALMTLAAIGLAESRILVVAPSRVIREQIGREFSTLKIAKQTGCLEATTVPPAVQVLSSQLKDARAWNKIEDFNVVVATSKCVSPAESGVFSKPPRGLFDLIIFDEAHHLPAQTWIKIVEHFNSAQVITCTATPFRNDKKPLPGNIVYFYPLRRAIERGIYSPIEFIPVAAYGPKENRDLRLAKRAKEIWEIERQERKVKILVRAGFIKETKPIQALYHSLGINLEIVTSDKSLIRNEKAIQRAITDEDCHGLISVGMLGEGLDLPMLRIAVMHKPHQSFPVTLQFIGRICRTIPGERGRSKLIAIPEEVQEHTKGLYDENASWMDLIPDLADAATDLEQRRRRYAHENWKDTTQEKRVAIHTIFPSFSVSVYRAAMWQDLTFTPRLEQSPRLSDTVSIIDEFVSKRNDWRVFITRTIKKPRWTTSTSLLDKIYDLHIYYRNGDLLFESTTAPGIAMQLRAELPGYLTLIEAERVEQVISQEPLEAYYNVGLRRVGYASSSLPSYKMLSGSHAENAIRASDGSHFSAGHLFARVESNGDGQVIGISAEKAKIWSAGQTHIESFTTWCNNIAQILTNQQTTPLPFLSHLRRRVLADSIPAKPFFIEFNEDHLRHIRTGLKIQFPLDHRDANEISAWGVEILESESSEGNLFVQIKPEIVEFKVDYDSWLPDSPKSFSFEICFGPFCQKMQYNLSEGSVYQFQMQQPILDGVIKLEENGREYDYTITRYFLDYPLTIYLEDGSAICGRYHFPYDPPKYNLPEEVFNPVNWRDLNCRITVEDVEMARNPQVLIEMAQAGEISVIEAAAHVVKPCFSSDAVIFCDHRAGEIADYVVVDREEGRPLIYLIHCKASELPKKGARVADAYEVLGQARKCQHWIGRTDLYDLLRKRIQRIEPLQGTLMEMERHFGDTTPQLARFGVGVVQPGFDLQKIQQWQDPALRSMFLSLYDELRSQDISLLVFGS